MTLTKIDDNTVKETTTQTIEKIENKEDLEKQKTKLEETLARVNAKLAVFN
jgi:hypothetical protein